jgi:putative endonuclease
MRDARQVLGAAGEALAARWYEAAGYAVVDRNWRCREGELDLVATASGVVAFCEVKTRRGDRFGAPFEAVTPAKQRRLRGLAARWLAEHPEARAARVRFDVASVRVEAARPPSVDVVQDAF